MFPPPFSILAFISFVISKAIQQVKENKEDIYEELFLEKKFAEEYFRCIKRSKMENCEYKIKINTEKYIFLNDSSRLLNLSKVGSIREKNR